MPPATESRLLLQKAALLYTSTLNKANKTFEDTYNAGLAEYCRAIFSSDTERAKYDETLRLQGYEEIKQKVNIAGAVTKVIHAAQVELLLHEAKEMGFDLNEARSFILDYARKKGFVVCMYEPKQADRLQNLEDELKLLQAKGHILEDEAKLLRAKGHLLEEEIKSLTREYTSIACEADIRQHVTMPMVKSLLEVRPQQEVMAPPKVISGKLPNIYGIDFGMTNSCIAYVDEYGKPTVIFNAEGENITPSVVFFDGNTSPLNMVFSFERR